MHPKISLLVLAGGSAGQTAGALSSLELQEGVALDDYELIVVERASNAGSGGEPARVSGRNVRYVALPAEGVSPFDAFDAASRASRAPLLGFLAAPRLVTRRLIRQALVAARLAEQPIVVAPSYDSSAAGPLDAAAMDPDRLFLQASFSDTNPNGYLCNVTRAELFFCRRTIYERLRDAERVESCDALFGALCKLAECRLIVLGGEACFRLGSETSAVAPEASDWQRADRQPLLFGVVPDPARSFLAESLQRESIHEALTCEAGREQWAHEAEAGKPASQRGAGTDPLLSIVVFVYRIPRQAENTLYSLSALHQRGVRPEDYEIIVVESDSQRMLGPERVARFGGNLRYSVCQDGANAWAALRAGLAQARGRMLGVLLDAARVVTPGVVQHALLALAAHSRPLCAVPGYHLSTAPRSAGDPPCDEATELRWLEAAGWRKDGYRLFEVASSDTLALGSLNSFLDGTCLFFPKACLDELGGLQAVGDGHGPRDLFQRLASLPDTSLVALWSEGTFHQYHHGVPSGSVAEREALVAAFRRYVEMLRGRRHRSWTRDAELLGICAAPSQALLAKAAWLGLGKRQSRERS